MIKAFFEVYKILNKIGIKPKDVIGMGGDIVKMGKSLFNTRVNPKLLEFIAKNQKIPCSVTKTYYTRHDNQTAVDCRITQSSTETEDLDEWVNIIANQELSLPSGRKKGQEIDVTYAYDENGTMHASFIDVETGKETYIKKSDLTPDDDDDLDDYIVD